MSNDYSPERRFNDRAADYDNDIYTVIPGYYSLHESTYFLLESLVPYDASILIAGAGTGYEAVYSALNSPGWRITGFDISGEMLKKAGLKIKRNNIEDHISLFRGTPDSLGHYEFNAVLSILVMHFIADKAAYLSDIYNSLKPGGVLLIADITGDKCTEEFDTMLTAWKHFQLEKRKDPDKVEESMKHIKQDIHMINEDQLYTLLKDTGFTGTYNYWRNLLINCYLTRKL